MSTGKTVLKIVGIVTVVLLLIIGLFVFSFIQSFGSGDVKALPEKQVAEKLQKVEKDFSGYLSDLKNETIKDGTAFSADDNCIEGQYNWKVKDDYNNICTFKIQQFYSFSGDFETEVKELKESLKNAGWNDYDNSIDKFLDDYQLSKSTSNDLFADLMLKNSLFYENSKGDDLNVTFSVKETVDLTTAHNYYASNLYAGEFSSSKDLDSELSVDFTHDVIGQNNQYVVSFLFSKEYFRN